MNDKADLLAIIADELRGHPQMGPEDLRKLIVQSVLGGDHLLNDLDRFRRELLREWAEIPREPIEPIGREAIQPIDPEGRTARVHLLPCKGRGVEVDALVRLLAEQPRKNGSQSALEARWEIVVDFARAGHLPFDPSELSDLAVLARLPHHSVGYGFASYRVINDITRPKAANRLREWGILS